MVAASALCGCVGSFERPNVPAVIEIPPQNKATSYSVDAYVSDLATYKTVAADAKRAWRDKMVYPLVAGIDYAYYDYETKIFPNESRFHVGYDFLQLGLAAGSTVTNGERSKIILIAY